jgi:diguanylate cyclase (GGDEF)-like protein
MNDQRPAWRVNSGMLARLTGPYRAQKESSVEPELAADPPAPEIPDFQQTRNLIFQACSEAFRAQQPVSLIVLTIDEFAAFERNYGNDAAAKASMFIERTLYHHRDLIFGTESGVVIGRYVESRYLILLPGINGAIAQDYADYIRKSVVATEFVWNYRSLYFTVSIGISHKPGHNGDQDMLILQADQACDQVIATGGNRIAVARITTPC